MVDCCGLNGHATTECCCAGNARTSIRTGVKGYQVTIDIANSLFFQSFWQQSAGHGLLSLGGVSSTPGINCPRGGNTALPICHGLIQTALEQDDAPEHL